jgi:hypothetical protein
MVSRAILENVPVAQASIWTGAPTMNAWLAFALGMFIGANLGLLTFGLLMAARHGIDPRSGAG